MRRLLPGALLLSLAIGGLVVAWPTLMPPVSWSPVTTMRVWLGKRR